MKKEDIINWFNDWCKRTSRNGGVLIGKSIIELLQDFASYPEATKYSPQYLMWVKETNQSGLTSGQHKFAEWCIKNTNTVTEIGNREEIFISIRKFLKDYSTCPT